MNSLFLLLLFLTVFSQTLTAQPDTLLANSSHTMALLFPSSIRQEITGAENFTFSYSVEEKQRLGLLQASPGPNSNLLVITTDDRAYMYELRYEPQLLKTYHVIKEEENIIPAIIKPTLSDSLPELNPSEMTIDSIRLEKGCQYVLERSESALKTKRKNDITLRLMEMAYYGREVFLVMEMVNHSRIDFELDYIECYIIQGNPSKKSSFQKSELKPLYKHNLTDNLRAATENRFVFVVQKFTLSNGQKIVIELKEKWGSRSLTLQY